MIDRRSLIFGTAATLLTPPSLAAARGRWDIDFDVRIAGQQVGHHRLRFRQDDDGALHVTVDVIIKVRLMFMTAFDYRQQAEEIWRGDRLERLESRTVDGDDSDHVLAERTSDGRIPVQSRRAGDRTVDGAIWPTSAFWRPAAVERTEFLDVATGVIRPVSIAYRGLETVEALGRERSARRYAVDTSRDFDVWYGSDGEWLRLEWSGFGLTARYHRVA